MFMDRSGRKYSDELVKAVFPHQDGHWKIILKGSVEINNCVRLNPPVYVPNTNQDLILVTLYREDEKSPWILEPQEIIAWFIGDEAPSPVVLFPVNLSSVNEHHYVYSKKTKMLTIPGESYGTPTNAYPELAEAFLELSK